MLRVTKLVNVSIFLFVLVALTGCGLDNTSQTEIQKIKETVVSEFKKEGIHLKEVDTNGKLFSYTKSDEYHYDFKDGDLIIVCCYKDKTQQRKEINYSLARYDISGNYLIAYFENYAIYYNSLNENITQKAKNAFNNLRK